MTIGRLLSEHQTSLLRDLLAKQNGSSGAPSLKFRADHDENLEDIASLQAEGWIENRDGEYFLSLSGLSEIRSLETRANDLLKICEALYVVLRALYKEEPNRTVQVAELAAIANLSPEDVQRALPHLKQAALFGGWSASENEPDSYIALSEELIRHKSFQEIIDVHRGWPLRRRQEISARSRATAGTFDSPFDTYVATGRIGEGGAGIVLAVQDSEGAEYALKHLRLEKTDRRRLKRFQNEIRFGQSVHHKNLVPILDVGVSILDGAKVPFFVMPRYERTLRQVMSQGVEAAQALAIFRSILDGLEAAHGQAVVHRDLKPENILLSADVAEVRICDFGIAQFSEEELYSAVETRNGDRLANFIYAAPEQRRRGAEVDRKADYFALGLMLNELLTGLVPHGARYERVSARHKELAHLDGLVEQLISQRPEDRPESIAQIRAALSNAQSRGGKRGPSSTGVFSGRFKKAFPGVRGVEKFEAKAAISRLTRLLCDPLRVDDKLPIWWWRSGDMPIEQLRVLNDETVLMDGQELIIDWIAAVNEGAYYQQFLYLQAKGAEPTGLYAVDIEEERRELGFAREEYAVYEGRLVPRAHYDDGATVVNGEVVTFQSPAELRTRYLTPYNLLIAPLDSPINNNDFDVRRDELIGRSCLRYPG